jgi:hypothetical protein
MKNGPRVLRDVRTSGGVIKVIGDFPFMLSGVEAFFEFFSAVVIDWQLIAGNDQTC